MSENLQVVKKKWQENFKVSGIKFGCFLSFEISQMPKSVLCQRGSIWSYNLALLLLDRVNKWLQKIIWRVKSHLNNLGDKWKGFDPFLSADIFWTFASICLYTDLDHNEAELFNVFQSFNRKKLFLNVIYFLMMTVHTF